MNKFVWPVLLLMVTLSSCRSQREVWEDTKTCGRYMGKGVRSLFGENIDSRENAKFYESWEEEPEFIALGGKENQFSMSNIVPKDAPGDPHSPIPGIDRFYKPMGKLAAMFSNVHFVTDNYSVQGSDNLSALKDIADFLAKNPRTYVFIEGHADERGPAAYNLSLGSKRSNSVRNFLIQNGVSPDQLFTISYGKERPLVLGHDSESWEKNRRVQFVIYEKR